MQWPERGPPPARPGRSSPATGSRRLLLHKKQILKLEAAAQQKGLTIVPLTAYFNDQNRLKLQIGLAKGKAQPRT